MRIFKLTQRHRSAIPDLFDSLPVLKYLDERNHGAVIANIAQRPRRKVVCVAHQHTEQRSDSRLADCRKRAPSSLAHINVLVPQGLNQGFYCARVGDHAKGIDDIPLHRQFSGCQYL